MSSNTEIAVQAPAVQGAVTTIAPITFKDVEALAGYIVRSGMFGIQKEDQAISLMMLCQAEGLHPMQAVRRYHLIEGKPTMRADAMLAEFQARGGRVAWGERTNTIVSAVFSHPSCGDVPVIWTIEDAKRAGLTGKAVWQKFPRQMLAARVISEGIRAAMPGVNVGIYTPEEVIDFDAAPIGPIAPMGASAPVILPPTAPPAAAPTPGPAQQRPQTAPAHGNGSAGVPNRLPECSEPGCGKPLTSGQVMMSTNKFGRPLCPNHQRNAVPVGSAAQPGEPIPPLGTAPKAEEPIDDELLDDSMPFDDYEPGAPGSAAPATNSAIAAGL